MRHSWLNSIIDSMGQRIQEGNWPGSYLFELNQSMGSDRLAEAMIIRLLCHNADQPGCERCIACQRLQAESNPDLLIVKQEEGAQSIKIDDLRRVLEKCEKSPVVSRHQVLYIPHCEKMTVQCANALLKTLEEPKANLQIILHTEKLNLLLPTIKSRCQIEVIKPDLQALETAIDEAIAGHERYTFIRYTHRDRPLDIAGVVQNDEVYELYQTWVETLTTKGWQPLGQSDRLAGYGLTEVLDAGICCLGALGAKTYNLSCQELDLYTALSGVFPSMTRCHLSRWDQAVVLRELMTTKKLLSGGMVHSGEYLLDSVLIKVWQTVHA